MVSFIHHGSDITTWMRYNFKIESAKFKGKQYFQDKDVFFESQAADH